MIEEIGSNTIALAKAGDDSALAELYERYQPKIERFLYYRTGDAHVAEDLTTEVFLRVIEKLPQYELQETPIQAWIFRIARNLAIDHFRRQSVRKHVALDASLPANGDSPDTVAARSLVCEELRGALDRLTDGQADVIVLRFISGMTIAETAQTLNKSESAIKGLQGRALDALHRAMAKRRVAHEQIA